MKTYTVQKDGFMFGRYVAAGSPIDLTATQARPYLLDGRVAPGAPGAGSSSRGAKRKTTSTAARTGASETALIADDGDGQS